MNNISNQQETIIVDDIENDITIEDTLKKIKKLNRLIERTKVKKTLCSKKLFQLRSISHTDQSLLSQGLLAFNLTSNQHLEA